MFDAAYAVAGKEMSASQLNAYFEQISSCSTSLDVDRLFAVYNNAIEALEYNSMGYSNEISNLTSKADSVELSSAETKTRIAKRAFQIMTRSSATLKRPYLLY